MQSGRKGEGKAAGAGGRKLRNFVGRKSRYTMPVKKGCGNGSKQTALTGSKEGDVFAMPLPPSSLFHSSRQSESPNNLEIPALSPRWV